MVQNISPTIHRYCNFCVVIYFAPLYTQRTNKLKLFTLLVHSAQRMTRTHREHTHLGNAVFKQKNCNINEHRIDRPHDAVSTHHYWLYQNNLFMPLTGVFNFI